MRTDLITRYLALPKGLEMKPAAHMLGVSLTALQKAKRAAGLTVIKSYRNGYSSSMVAEDRDIAERYKLLDPKYSLVASANRLGVGEGRLVGALMRTGTPRHVAPAPATIEPMVKPTPRNGVEALPPGSPETWDVLGFGPWPFG